MFLEGRVGGQQLANGSLAPISLTKDGAINALVYGKYAEAVLRGIVWSGSTAATGVAPGTSVGTTAAFSLYNPIGSGVRLVVLRTTMGYISGTLGAGTVHYLANTNPSATATTGTAITAKNALLSDATSAGRPFTTATIPSPSLLRPFCSLQASLASTAVAPWYMVDDVDGEFIVPPGCTLSLHATAAGGSSPLVVFGMTWAEVTI